jgi:methylenetetrahydrofolate dehydrogenase (NADP+)/methenyltetrahydrofolate cyclohydrolase
MIIDGRSISNSILVDLGEKTKKLSKKPKLLVILLGRSSASLSYIKQKERSSAIAGIDFELRQMSVDTTEVELVKSIQKLNDDNEINGIIVQLPLPRHINTNAIIETIDPKKDVDGFTSQNIGKLFLGTTDLISCTPKGIMRLLKESNIKIC